MKKNLLNITLFLTVCGVLWGEKRTVKGTSDFDAPKSGGFIYSPVGKRDPFKAPQPKLMGRDLAAVNPLERFNLEQLHLRAILKGLGKNKAMFEDPDGKTHILNEGSLMGREKATISRILNTEVILTVKTFNYLGQESIAERVISLPSDEETEKPNPQLKRAP